MSTTSGKNVHHTTAGKKVYHVRKKCPPRQEKNVHHVRKNVQNTTTIIPDTRETEGRPISTNTIPVFGDSTWYDAWPRHTDQPAATMDAFGIGDRGTSGEMNHFCIDRHDGFINLVFMDWSARDVGLKELWTLKWHRAYVTNGPWTKAGGARPEDWPAWLRNYRDY